ncbi:protein RGF1 INDUCIBLE TRANSCRIPTION FACTOR 1-like [Quercus robur]|uniref:protein RGF1 INDUCIBLE TRANSCRIPTION FACTOR 1-like n=1 Tax=Quercus robur TaxID=38942 RepID=UPI002161E38D|nr:protein RGF1 INDUCIBLE TRANSCRIPTION FACTOR 1-like [Quercus robur]
MRRILSKSYVGIPPWLNDMYNSIYFITCIMHQDAKKNDLDHFCIDCHRSLCSNCLYAHMHHNYVKIRRYVYNDVINRQDLCNLFNCSGIQSYHTNGAKVVFLKPRTHRHQQQKQSNLKDHRCTIRNRTLQDNSLYCSVACKVLALHDNQTNEKNEDLDNVIFGDRKYLAESSKRRKLRKAAPLRAPMF